ncbi:MAG: diguanylate cyclase [Synergistaceae bacterium]|nr:diguanylate cyclase [Synergistaceae bacterium]
MNIFKRVSIKKSIMALYIVTILITFGIVYYLLFSKTTIFFSVILILAISLLFLRFVDKMLKPIESLNTSTKKFTDGDFTERARIFREDEIGSLARTFNELAETITRLVKNLETKVKERTTDLEKTNGVLQENKEQLKLILDSTAEGIYGIDTEGRCTFCNESALNMLGYESQSEVLGKNMHLQIHHTKPDGTLFPASECRILQTFKKGKGVSVNDEVFWRKDKTSFDVRYSSYPQHINKVLIGAVVTFMDNTEQKKSEEHIKYLTYHDPLTDIHNRLFFEEEIKRIDKENVLPVSVIFGDLNGLKLTNDIFGHSAGDQLLKDAASAFRKASKETGVAARIGGDEFALILPSCDDKKTDRIMADIKHAFEEVHSKEIIGSISLGASTKTSPEQGLAEIIETAENNMYRDKTMDRKRNNKRMITKIISQLHKRSLTEKKHSENVSALSKKIASEMGLPEAQINRIAENGYFHDIGKIILDDNLLNKHKNFTKEEYREMQQHSVAGYRILNLFDETIDLADGVLSHHEHWDGTGYPKGIKGEEIPLSSRIISVAESFDAITNDYGDKSRTLQEAIADIKKYSGIKYDPAVVDAFINVTRQTGQEKNF